MADARDIAIIGAGPAGCVAAIMLARAGRRVMLIEQHRFPRDKVCGECLSSVGIDVMRRLGLDDALLRLGPAILTQTILHAPDGSTARIPLPQSMWGLSRGVMDQALLEEARAAGAVILQPVRVESIEPGKPVMVLMRDLSTNQVANVECQRVIIADGKGALLDNRPAATGDLGIKTHFENIDGPTNAIELFGVRGHYGGLARIEGGLWNTAFSVPAARVKKFAGDFDGMLEEIMLENVGLRLRFRSARRVAAWLGSPLPRHRVSRKWSAGIIPIGNAAAALEPIGGEGMGLAMASAELAARAILDDTPLKILPRQFERLWRVRRAACRGMALMISNPQLADLTVPAAASAEGLSRLVMRSMGKVS